MIQKIGLKNFEEYLKEIGQFPLLDQEEEKKLQKEITIEENRQRLFNSNLKLVVSVAEKLLRYGIRIEDLIEIGNEELEKAIDNYNSFTENKPDMTTSTYYTLRIRFGIIREIVNRNFPILTASIKGALRKNDFDGYYIYFFLEHALINLIVYKENGSGDAAEILENSLISTLSDPELRNRINGKNLFEKIPAFTEILKESNKYIQ